MFDVGFLELVVIMVLGLLVLGPERLPKAAQKVGYWFGKARRYVEGMKEQVEAEFDGAEVKRLLHNQEVQIRELQDKITDTESYIDAEYHNQFDDENDPGTSPEIAEETKPNELASEPQYDIIEEDVPAKDDGAEESAVKKNSAKDDSGEEDSNEEDSNEEDSNEEDKTWAEDPHSNKPFTEYKQTKHAQQIASSTNQSAKNQSAKNNAVGDKAQ